MKIYPSILSLAHTKGQPLGGWQGFFLAKDWERGTGIIPGDQFKEYLTGLGLASSIVDSWIDQACSIGLFQIVGKGFIKLASWVTAGKLAGCQYLDDPVVIEIDKFLSDWGK